MAQVWKCEDCHFATQDPKDAGDHERPHNNGRLATPGPGNHFMDDIGE